MKTDPHTESPEGGRFTHSLSNVLGQTHHIKELVDECVKELSSVNTAIKYALANSDPLPGVVKALEQSQAVQKKVHEAATGLSLVNWALSDEVRNRDMLDHQFAAAIEQEQGARHAAFHDILTGLPNRALFRDRLDHALAQAKRHNWGFAVMFFDLNNFKFINDSYGHEVGDSVIRTIARRLKENARGVDTVSRHGGDEFLCLLMEVSDQKAISTIAEKIMNAIELPCNVSVLDRNVSLTVKASMGISIFPTDGTTADSLISSADEAMYRAKQNRSGYSFVQ
jgi:diguanylate cyclase